MKRIISLLTIALLAFQMYGQSVNFVNISSDPTYFSLGGASLTTDANAFSVNSNASAMALSTDTMAVAASYGMWQPKGLNLGMASVSGYGLIGGVCAVGINGKYMMYKPYDIVEDNGFANGQFTPVEMAVELGVAYKIIEGLSAGVNVRYISSKLAGNNNSGTAVSADVSVSYRLKGLRFALAATNIGTKIDYGYSSYQLPAMAKVGVGYSYAINPKNTISAHLEGDYLLYKSSFMAGLGAEYNYNDMISARVGYHYGNEKAIPSFASAGIGVKIIGITLNAAYVLGFSNSPINGSCFVSLGYEF